MRVFTPGTDRIRDAVPEPPLKNVPASPATPDAVDVASEESFPASDPPSFTTSRA